MRFTLGSIPKFSYVWRGIPTPRHTCHPLPSSRCRCKPRPQNIAQRAVLVIVNGYAEICEICEVCEGIV